jgi:hypothetical protein
MRPSPDRRGCLQPIVRDAGRLDVGCTARSTLVGTHTLSPSRRVPPAQEGFTSALGTGANAHEPLSRRQARAEAIPQVEIADRHGLPVNVGRGFCCLQPSTPHDGTLWHIHTVSRAPHWRTGIVIDLIGFRHIEPRPCRSTATRGYSSQPMLPMHGDRRAHSMKAAIREGGADREWVAAGCRLGGISRCNQWWLGDRLRYRTSK